LKIPNFILAKISVIFGRGYLIDIDNAEFFWEEDYLYSIKKLRKQKLKNLFKI